MPLPALRRALAALLVAAPLVAQDTTSRGVRIGLTYDPGTKPGVVVLPVSGARGDSIRAIVQRDLDYGDRVNAIVLEGSAAQEAARASGPNWPLLARLGAAAAVAVTPTPHDRARKTHEEAAVRHAEAAAFWDERGDQKRAELERRNAQVEREAAEIEAERARLARAD